MRWVWIKNPGTEQTSETWISAIVKLSKKKLWFPWASILNFDPGHQASKAERQVSSKRSVYSQDLSLENVKNRLEWDETKRTTWLWVKKILGTPKCYGILEVTEKYGRRSEHLWFCGSGFLLTHPISCGGRRSRTADPNCPKIAPTFRQGTCDSSAAACGEPPAQQHYINRSWNMLEYSIKRIKSIDLWDKLPSPASFRRCTTARQESHL